mmetsp:Transcript_127930/g.235372  ORF Transcript_127930/g.235372 Transcript_127930/m.235372 type:complete len:644 (+) Transcript_127930:194-2125(+)
MKRSLSTEVDIGVLLDGFLSERADARRRSAEALEKWRREDAGGLASTLASRISAPDSTTKARSLAAVLLRKVLLRSAKAIGGTPDSHPALGDAVLKALAAALPDSTVRRHTADAAATAASIYCSSGRAWPEFSTQLACWCVASCSERSAVLRVLEQLGDDSEECQEDAGDESSSAMGTASAPCNPDESGGAACSRAASFYALLAFLEDHGGALHSLLATALQDDEDEASREAAARVYILCVASDQAPMPIRTAVRDLAAIVADAATGAALAYAKGEADQGGHGEACMQAVALAARADPGAWAPAAGLSQAALPAALATAVASSTASIEVRTAALAALLELTDAASSVSEAASVEAGNVFPFGMHTTAEEITKHAVTATTAVLTELPLDEGIDEWAVEVDGEVVPGGADGAEGLLDAALDGAARLAQRGGAASLGLAAAVPELCRREAWQARHGALLLQLRLACAAGEPEAETAVQASLEHFGHVHPRVRWAALEVWARLIASGFAAPRNRLGEAVEALSLMAGSDPYMRVRRHGLFVLLVATSLPELPTAAHVELIFRRVLIPQAASLDDSIREACATIANGLAAVLSSSTATDTMQDSSGAPAAGLWAEFQAAAASSESACQADSNANHEDGSNIQWPADWR